MFRRGGGPTAVLPSSRTERPQENVFQKEAERKVAAMLKGFGLKELVPAVRWLAEEGLTTVALLRATDLGTLTNLGIQRGDADRIALSMWLHEMDLAQYGPELTGCGCSSLLDLLRVTDEELKAAGVRAIGHRRALLRALREDGELHALASNAALEAQRVAHSREPRLGRREPQPKKPSGHSAPDPTSTSGAGAVGLAGEGGRVVGGNLRVTRSFTSFGMPAQPLRNDLPPEPWREPWRTTASASLLGIEPGATAEVYHTTVTSRLQLKCAGGVEINLM